MARIKLITFNTGKGWDNKKKRPRLENKRYSYMFSEVDITIYNKDLVAFVKSKIYEFYEFDNTKKLIVYGDSAGWIKTLAKAINAIYVTDRWHGYKVLAKVFVVGKKKDDKLWDEFELARELFRNNKHDKLMELLINNNANEETIKYFRLIKNGMQFQNDPIINIGGSAESDVYHVVKSTCKGARIFSKQHFLNMLNKKIEKLNDK